MSKKHLKFVEPDAIDHHLVVINKKKIALGTICESGQIFRSPVFMDLNETEWTSDCLRELADEIDSRFKRKV